MSTLTEYGHRLILAEAECERLRQELEASKGFFNILLVLCSVPVHFFNQLQFVCLDKATLAETEKENAFL